MGLCFLSIGSFSVPKVENVYLKILVGIDLNLNSSKSFVNYFIVKLQTQHSVVNVSSCGCGYVMEVNMSGPSRFPISTRQRPICEVRRTNCTFKETNFSHSCNRKTIK